LPVSPQGEAGAFKNSPVGYFSEQAGLPRWLPAGWLLRETSPRGWFFTLGPPRGGKPAPLRRGSG